MRTGASPPAAPAGPERDKRTQGIPHSRLHNLKHNEVLHESVGLLTVRTEDVPFVTAEDRIELGAPVEI